MLLVCAVLAGLFAIARPGYAQALPEACVDGGASSRFRASDRLAMTYFYYWYEPRDLDDPRLAIHPPEGAPFDWRDPEWHRQQLVDMTYAGLDVALAVYWGDVPAWSTEGLDPLVAAREGLLMEGARPPAIGLFLDTNLYSLLLPESPSLADLTTDEGLSVLVDQIMGFFDRVPACHWATIDDRPLIFLWRADTEDGNVFNFDQDAINSLYERLEERLGNRPIIVRERTWDARAEAAGTTAVTDAKYSWGSALRGVLFDGEIVSVGPGYDDRLVPERPGYVRDREESQRFADDLRVAASSGASWLLLETWNELWEGTSIAASAEHERTYLDVARRYVTMFHRLEGLTPRDGWVNVANGESMLVRVLADAAQEYGIPESAAGRWGARPYVEESDGAGYFHFALEPGLRRQVGGPAAVQVEYFDEGAGAFCLEYDSLDWGAPDERFKSAGCIPIRETRRWVSHRFELPDARFAARQYLGYGDFRIRDLPAPGEPTHLFGRVFVDLQPGTRPTSLAPKQLQVLRASQAAGITLHWTPVAGASWYVVQVAPTEALDSSAGTPVAVMPGCDVEIPADGRLMAVALQESCLLRIPATLPLDLYRWQVQALAANGVRIGEPSDWSYFLVDR